MAAGRPGTGGMVMIMLATGLLVLALMVDLVGAFIPGRLVHWSAMGRGVFQDGTWARLRKAPDQAYRDKSLRPLRGVSGASAGVGGTGDDARIVRQAKAWVRDVVVKLKLCPFAEAVFKASKGVRYVVTHAETTDGVWRDFLREVNYLIEHEREEVGTTLLLMPSCLADLQDFNDFCRWLEETIEGDELLVDKVLVACFHPRHAFHGLDEDDVLNYEKRSPHPTINLLRADMVDEYIAFGKTLGIAEHNERVLQKEGKDAVKAAFEATLALE